MRKIKQVTLILFVLAFVFVGYLVTSYASIAEAQEEITQQQEVVESEVPFDLYAKIDGEWKKELIPSPCELLGEFELLPGYPLGTEWSCHVLETAEDGEIIPSEDSYIVQWYEDEGGPQVVTLVRESDGLGLTQASGSLESAWGAWFMSSHNLKGDPGPWFDARISTSVDD